VVQEHEPAVPGICAAQQDMWGLVEDGEEREERKENEGGRQRRDEVYVQETQLAAALPHTRQLVSSSKHQSGLTHNVGVASHTM